MQLERLKNFFIDDCLPVWSLTSYDEQHGHFMESLRLDGSPETTGIVRTRTAARQLYVFAHASVLGVAPAGALEKAETAFANLHIVAWKDGRKPGYVRSFNRFTSEVIDAERDLYDNACALLALAWLYKATGKSAYRSYISAVIDAIDETLSDPFGGWAEDSMGTLPRQQNPHMHYLEACLALRETDDCSRYRELEGRLFTLLGRRFLGGQPRRLREYFGPHWEISNRFGSDRLSPGHMCEWVWLTGRHAALTNTTHNRLCDDLLGQALAIGRCQGSLFLVDQATPDGTPLTQSRRLWPQVEMLKAQLTQHRALRDESHLAEAEALASAIFKTYFQAAPEGCWHDVLDLNDRSIGNSIPASSLYHLWTVVAELLPRVSGSE